MQIQIPLRSEKTDSVHWLHWTHLTITKIIVILYIGEQDVAQLGDAVAARLAVEGLLPVCAVHVLIHPAAPLPPLCISAASICCLKM